MIPLVAPRDERETVYSCQPFLLANGLMLITGVPFLDQKITRERKTKNIHNLK